MRSCGKCVPAESYERLERHWYWMCALCVALMLVVAVGGVLALEWRRELSVVRHELDNATDMLAAKELADYKAAVVKTRRVKR